MPEAVLVELHRRFGEPHADHDALCAELTTVLSHDPMPLPAPEELSPVDILGMKVTEEGWRCDEEFACRTCGSPALLHPHTNHIWGCLPCGFSTASGFVYFKRRGA